MWHAVAQARRFLPFLEGSRQCVGMSLARMTTAATLAALLSQFTFRLADSVRASTSPGTGLLQWVPQCHSNRRLHGIRISLPGPVRLCMHVFDPLCMSWVPEEFVAGIAQLASTCPGSKTTNVGAGLTSMQ